MVRPHGSDNHGGMTETPQPGNEQTDSTGTQTTTTPTGPRVGAEQMRDLNRLRRSVTDRKIAGVAGGLGRHLDIDPTILRVVFVVLCFFGGAGFILYGAAWLLVPEEGKAEGNISASPSTRNAMLIVAGVLAALLLMGDAWGGFGFPWPLAVVALIIFAVLMNRDKAVSTSTPPGQWVAPGAPDAPASGDTAAFTTDQAHYDPNAPQPPAPPWMPPTQQTYPPLPPARAERGPKLFWITLALVAVALGSLGLYDVSGGAVTDPAYPALALTVVGAMLVVGAWIGRAGGLIFLGIIAALALALSSAVTNTDWSGDRRIDATPSSAAFVQSSYSVPAGEIHLDLSEVDDLEELDGREIDLDANAGEIVVVVPDGLDVQVDADVSVGGEVQVLDRRSDGTDVHITQSIDGGPDVPEIELDIQLLVGSIEVRKP